MPTLLRRLPFYLEATSLRIPEGPAIEIQHDQIVFWVSIAPAAQTVVPASSRRIPALLDLGFNGFFLLREDHLNQWLKIQLDEECFPFVRALNVGGFNIPTFEADAWLHPNVPGFRDQLADAPPLRLEMPGGIAVCPASVAQFRLPLLGVSALRRNGLRLFLNGEKRYITLRAAQARLDSPAEEGRAT